MPRQNSRLRELRSALEAGEEILAIHYACENLNEAKDRPAAVSCIAIMSMRNETSIAFSLADALPGMKDNEPEIDLLNRFYQHISDHREARIVHWNMNSSAYGFNALALRFRHLKGEAPPFEPPTHMLYDLDGIICRTFGDAYVNHPKLYSLASLNSLNTRSLLSGSDEANRFTKKDYGAIRHSTIAKTKIMSAIMIRLIEGNLQTQSSVGSLKFAGENLDAVTVVLELGDRFFYVKRSLTKRYGNRSPLLVNDEHDAQYLFRSLLHIFFQDIRPESWTPSYAGTASRIDFLLPDYSLAIELKHSRESMTSKTLSDELIVDARRYQEDSRVSHLICLVFDYDGRLDGPRGIESDLQKEHSATNLAVTVRIYDR